MKKSNKKIVVIGGGTGVYTTLSGLKPHFDNLTAIVTMADEGGSTGVLREEFGILPPGDARRALIALSSEKEMLAKLFTYRFQEGVGLTGHNFGNLLITAPHRLTDDFEKAVEEAGKILNISGKVVPVTLNHSRLMAELEDGQVIEGENNIDIPQHDGRLKIKRVWLKPPAEINPNAKKAILTADLIIIGPGDLYTSLTPNFLVSGMKEALLKTRAKKVYFTNLMTKFGETNNFRASDYVNAILEYLGPKSLDYVFVNGARPSLRRLAPYVKERSDFVDPDMENLGGAKLGFTPIKADFLRSKGFLRHDGEKIAKAIKMIL